MFIDNVVISFVHFLCEIGGGFFTPFFRVISFLGEKSWFFLLIAFVMCLKKKTRWVGITIILSIFIGWLTADLFLKPIFARLRPFQSSSEIYYKYWMAAGSIPETDYSMPSGHTLGVAAFFISFYITCAKNLRQPILITGIVMTILMLLSRCYFMHHYFTDCLVGIIIAFIMSFLSKIIVKFVFNLCKKYSDFFLFNFVLNFDFLKKH